MSDLQQKVLVAVISAALAGWLLPALTRQSADRQREIELKATLVGELSEGATRAFSSARAIIRQTLPEAAERRQRQEELREEGAIDTSCSAEELSDLCREEGRAVAERILLAREDWLELSDRLEAQVTVYFSEDLGGDLDTFSLRLLDYVRLTFRLRPEERASALRRLKDYLPTAEGLDSALLEKNPIDARSTGVGAQQADVWEGLWEVVEGKLRAVSRAVLGGDGKGFSTNYGDLACDLLFFVPFMPGCEG